MIWKLVPWQAWAGLALAVLIAGAVWRIDSAAYSRGQADMERQAIINAAKRIKDMENSNETFRRLPAHERCLAFMRVSGLPDSACD